MMKKILVVTMLLITSIFFASQNIDAATIFQSEPAANAGGLWHVEDGNRAYVNMRYTLGSIVYETGTSSNDTFPEWDLSQYVKWYGNSEELSFPNSTNTNQATISNPNPSIYTKFVVEIVSHLEAPAAEQITVQTYDSVVSNVVIDLHGYRETGIIGDWSYITMTVDGEEILSSRALDENPNKDDLFFGVRMYWEESETAAVIDPGDTTITGNLWEALPETSGSPVNPVGDWGTVTDISVTNQSIAFNVNYLGTTYPVSDFTVEGDLDFINKSNDVLYYTDPTSGDRILYFNFGETLNSAILAGRTFSDVDVWKGEALWNLTLNQIKVTDVLTVYNYIPEVDEDGNIYSYFYMPDVPMEDLISVSAVLAYRYYDDGFLNLGDLEPGEIQYKSVAAVKGETSSVNPTWVETAYTTAYIAGALATVGVISGVVAPIYGLPITAACFITAGVLTAADINEWFAYDIEQIQHVIPNASLVNEINTYIAEQNGSDQFTVDTDKLYKLHLATLQEGDEVQIMDELSNVTQVVWESDGQIYVVNDENILDVAWGGPGTLEPVELPGNSDLEQIVYIAAACVAVYIGVTVFKKKPALFFILLGGVVYYLYTVGVIT